MPSTNSSAASYCATCGALYPAGEAHLCLVDPRLLMALISNAVAAAGFVQQVRTRLEAAKRQIVIPGQKPPAVDTTPLIKAVEELAALGFLAQTTGPRRLPLVTQ